MIRFLPLALQGSSKVPAPDEPSGHGWLGFFTAALATGAALGAGGGADTTAGVALGAAAFSGSFSQPTNPNASTAANVPIILPVLDMVTSNGSCGPRRGATLIRNDGRCDGF